MPEGFNLGQAYGTIVLDGSQVGPEIQSVGKTVSSGLKEIGNQLTNVGLSLTALGLPFLAFAKTAVQAVGESQQTLAQLDAVLRSSGGAAGVTRDAAIGLSKELQNLTTYSDEQVLSAENLLLTFTNIGGQVFPDTTRAVLDMSKAMGQDLKSSAVMIGKAMNDPLKGMTALQRVGVTFTQSQKDMIKAMVNSGNIMGAQKLILKELQTEFGGSAEAAGNTFPGSLEKLQNKFNDLQETIGYLIIPVVQQFTGFLSDLIDQFNNLDPSTQQTIVNVGLLLAGLAVIGPVIAAVGVGLSAIGGVLAFLVSPLGLVIAAVVGLAAAFATNFGGIRDTLEPILKWLNTNFGDVWTSLWAGVPPSQILSGLLYRLLPPETADSIVNGLTNIRNWLGGVVDSVKQFIDKHPDFVVALGLATIGVGFLALAMAGLSAAIGLISGIGAAGALAGLLGVLTGPLGLIVAIGGLIALMADKYPGGIAKLLSDAATSARELADGFFSAATGSNGMQGAIDKAAQTLATIWAIVAGIRGGQFSIGTVLKAIGDEISAEWSNNKPYSAGGSRGFGDVSGLVYAPSNVQPIPAPAQSGQGFSGGGGNNLHVEGGIHIHANDEAGGRAAMKGALDQLDELYKSRGN